VRSSPRSSWIAALTLALVAAAPASAHRRDEYLQAARLAIEPDRVELGLDLTPGIAVAEQVLAEIDRDGDKAIAPDEGRAYTHRLMSGIALDIDGRPLEVELTDAVFPAVDAIFKGEGMVRLVARAALPELAAGVHRLRYRNTNRPEISAYLANALAPGSDRISIRSQQRDRVQRDLTIEYVLRPDAATRLRAGLWVAGTGVLIWLTVVWRRRAAPPATRL
jgi:hypothetical protein